MKLKYIILLVLALSFAVIYFVFDPSSALFPKCPLYLTTGVYCPGCGSQRAFHDLIHFNLKGMIQHNILFPFGIIVVIYYFIVSIINRNRKKPITNILNFKITPIIILIIIILYWILRNLPFEPFIWLAPN